MTTNKFDFIFFSDMHLTEKTPRSRMDDFFQAQKNKLSFISDLQKQHSCPVFHAGDLFDNWNNVSFEYFNEILKYIPEQLITIAGQHDLPRHRLQYIKKSPLWTLYQSRKCNILHSNWWTNEFGSWGVFGLNWEEDIVKEIPEPPIHVARKILLIHKTLWYKKRPYPGVSDSGNAQTFIDKHGGGFDLIISGDNHIPFALNHRGTTLINCGSATRMKCNEAHTPCCYGYRADTNKVKRIKIPCDKTPFELSAKKELEKQENLLQDFIDTLKITTAQTLSFEDNIKNFLKINPQSASVNDIICKAMEN